MKRGSSKGQISVFIILSILIIGIIVGFLLFKELGFNFEKNIPLEVQPVYSFVEQCIKEVGEEAVYEIGRNGGYFITQEPALEESIPFYLYENKNYMPSKEKVEEELSTYIEFMIPFCINGFEEFRDFKAGENFSRQIFSAKKAELSLVSEKEISVKTKIESENVIFTINYPLYISKENASYSLKNFAQKIPVRLGIIYQAIAESMEEQMKKTDAVCVTCLYNISETYGLHFHVLDTNETNILLFVIRDEKLKILGEDYQYFFANKLSSIKNEKN